MLIHGANRLLWAYSEISLLLRWNHLLTRFCRSARQIYLAFSRWFIQSGFCLFRFVSNCRGIKPSYWVLERRLISFRNDAQYMQNSLLTGPVKHQHGLLLQGIISVRAITIENVPAKPTAHSLCDILPVCDQFITCCGIREMTRRQISNHRLVIRYSRHY